MNKYQIRFFFEYGGGCLWGVDKRTIERFGYPIEPEKLPLKKGTIDQIKILATHFQTSLNWEDPASESPWDKEKLIAFKEDAEKLLIIIKTELSKEFEIHNELHYE